MSINFDAIYDDGVLRPMEPLALAQGARVHLCLAEENGTVAADVNAYNAWLDSLAGRWHGDFTRESEGDVESREPLS